MAISVPALANIVFALADMALPLSIFSPALAYMGAAHSIMAPAHAIFFFMLASAGLKSASSLAEVSGRNSVGTFSTRFSQTRGAAFDAMTS